ncbi:MAG: hypothetical protein WCE79_00280 [Xanthobacteraceae bacterium]
MKHFALAAMLAVAALLAGSLSAPAQAQRGGPYWYPGGGPTTGGMFRKSDKKTAKKSNKKTHKKSLK